ncbi:aminotransferase class V-fold PLP-dependent enzyme, partial [Caldimonas sp.]|uniref:aminotransferase class V-fold PLP-dependent enzyme n=1 Tax=Caldimonas sp. TaxID=2838790 RepID=UPI00391BB9BE
MKRPYNFSAGPAALPQPVLEQAAAEMLDWHGSGMSVMEMSHRGREFGEIIDRAEADLRELLGVPAHFKVLFMQGGGLGENAIVPLNLSRGGAVDFVVTGSWSAKSFKEAARYCDPAVGPSNKNRGHTTLPDPHLRWLLSGAVSNALGSPLVMTTLNLLNDAPDSDPLRLDVSLPNNSLLAILGSVTATLASGTLT